MKILTVAGSSGGHIFPALAFLDTLNNKRKDADLLLVLPKKSVTLHLESPKYKINYISISSIKSGFGYKGLIAIMRFLKGSWESIIILLRFRPDIVVGFGSLVCIPMVLFAHLFRIRTLIHEQNVIPGRACRFLAKFADRIAISFTETAGYFKSHERKVIFTGNPIRKDLIRIDRDKALDFFGLNRDKFTVLVMGGSQASHRINLGFLNAVSAIKDKSFLQVIHLAGAKDSELLKKSYADLNINFRLFDFLGPMQYAYCASDLVVSRAGATTVAEIMFFRVASILIPYPFASRHQMANAKVLEAMGSGIIIQDDDLDTGILRRNIEEFISSPERIAAMRSYYGNTPFLNANDLLVESALTF